MALKTSDTSAYLLLRILFHDAMKYQMTYGVSMPSGFGKTFTAKGFESENENVVVFEITALTSAKDIAIPKGTELVIFDGMQNAKNRTAKKIFNLLSDTCGFILLSTDEFRTKIIDGVREKKSGYAEMYKKIGRRFIVLSVLSPTDIRAICEANGVCDDDHISRIQEMHYNSGLTGIEENLKFYQTSKS